MPYTVGCTPAPLTLTIHPKLGWQSLLGIAWICFVGYQVVFVDWPKTRDILGYILFAIISFSVLLSFIRRERIEIYPDQMVWRKTYFGFTRSNAAPLSDVLGAEWNEGEQRGRQGKGPDYVEFYLSNGSVKRAMGSPSTTSIECAMTSGRCIQTWLSVGGNQHHGQKVLHS